MGYQPFLIAPFGTGLDIDQEPWLSPVDAFTDIVNGHIRYGYIEKRTGYRLLGKMVNGRKIVSATNANPAVFTPESLVGLANGQSVELSYLLGGNWPNLNSQFYTIANLGADFTLIDSNGNPVSGVGLGVYTASSGYLGTFPGLRIMGIIRYIAQDGSRHLIVSDTRRFAIYNQTAGVFEPMNRRSAAAVPVESSNVDVWSSSDTDYIWTTSWQNPEIPPRVYMTNGKGFSGGSDGIVYYDASILPGLPPSIPSVVQFQPNLDITGTDGTGNRVLTGAKLLFTLKSRLLAIGTIEKDGANTFSFMQRLRWCAAQNPSEWRDIEPTGANFFDAPTGEQVVSGYPLGDMIVVFFTNSVWMVRYTGDPQFPFAWEKINSFRASDAKMGVVGYDRYVIGAGQRGITATDGSETRRIDTKIQTLTSDIINSEQFAKVFGARDYEKRRAWILFPSVESPDANSALIYDDESAAFSYYRFNKTVDGANVDVNVLGYGEAAKDLAAQDFIAANDLDMAAQDFTDEETALSFFWSKEAEIFLAGDRVGNINVLDTNTSDDGTEIVFDVTGSGWNPFKELGVEAQLGYMDLYLESDELTTMTVEFYKDDDEEPYASQQLDLLPDLTFIGVVTNVQLTNALDPTQGYTVSVPNSGLVTGQKLFLYGIGGIPVINDTQFQITVINPSAFTIAFDATGQGAYTGGGQAVFRKFYRTKVWKRAFAGGIGYVHVVRLVSGGLKAPLRVHAFKPWFRQRGRRTLG